MRRSSQSDDAQPDKPAINDEAGDETLSPPTEGRRLPAADSGVEQSARGPEAGSHARADALAREEAEPPAPVTRADASRQTESDDVGPLTGRTGAAEPSPVKQGDTEDPIEGGRNVYKGRADHAEGESEISRGSHVESAPAEPGARPYADVPAGAREDAARRESPAGNDESALKTRLINGIKWLQKNLAAGSHPNMVEHLEWVIGSPERALDLIYRLKEHNNGLSVELNNLQQNNVKLRDALDDLKYNYSRAAEQLRDVQYLRRHNAELSQSLRASEAECREVRQSYAELDGRANKLMSELASAKRNRATTYMANADSQNHLILQEFKSLRDQDLHDVSSEVFRHLSAGSRDMKSLRKAEIARIKSVLSKEILIKGRKALIGTQDQPDPPLSAAVPRIMASILKSLGGGDELPKRLHSDVEKLVAKGLEVLRKIKSADPSGELWMDEKGEPFDPQIHEPTSDCENGGRIDFTVYPSYIVGHRVFEKSLVRTYVE